VSLAGTLVDVVTIVPREAVTWQRQVGVAATATTLTKTAPAGWGNAGASSTLAIASGSDGSAEFSLSSDPGYAMFGLSSGDTDQGYGDIDYAFYTYPPSGELMVFENGNYRGSFGAYGLGDVLSITVESNVVRYRRNGEVLYTGAPGPGYPLRVDTSLYSPGALVAGATLVGSNLVDVTQVLPTQAVTWQNEAGVSATATTLTKTADWGWGNAGASSTKSLATGSDGYAEFTVPSDPGYVMFGLGNGDDDQGYADIGYAFYAYPPSGQLMVFENGNYEATVGAYAVGEKLRIAVEGNVVRYLKNGDVVYTSATTPTSSLRVDTSLYSPGATVEGATLAGTLVP
jgi:hypothetical protein